MKNIARKTDSPKNNVLSLVNNRKFQAGQMAKAESELFSHTLNFDRLQFQAGDKVICRTYLGEPLSPDAIVIAETESSEKTLTTAANAVKVLAVVTAYQREVVND